MFGGDQGSMGRSEEQVGSLGAFAGGMEAKWCQWE